MPKEEMICYVCYVLGLLTMVSWGIYIAKSKKDEPDVDEDGESYYDSAAYYHSDDESGKY